MAPTPTCLRDVPRRDHAPVMKRIRCNSPDETLDLGRRLGVAAFPGAVMALEGDLGAGKTLLARGIGLGLGIPGQVSSPTFLLMMVHDGGRLPLVHADMYRIGSCGDLEQVGLHEFLEGTAVVVVEWADRFSEWLPSDVLWVRMDFVAGCPRSRDITLEASGDVHRVLESCGDG